MIKKIILLLIIVLGFESQAQVGINTTAPKAQLEIKSTNEATPASTDGLLIPKINAFPLTNPTVDQQGMLVYLTTTVGANTPGFYYWNNPTVAWIPIGNNNNSNWKLTGNSGTNPANNFIGTIDNQDVVFRRNDIVSGRLGTLNSSYGVNALSANTTGSNNTANGVSALQNNTSGFFNTANGFSALLNNTTGFSNTANGVSTLRSNTSGFSNTANGVSALQNNTTGFSNTANGSSALFLNTSGFSNTANGLNALQSNTTGNSNTANGVNALQSNSIGNFNTANGLSALISNTAGESNTANGVNSLSANTTGSNNTANGMSALQNTTIGNSNTANGRSALLLNTTGSSNTANGSSALFSNITGSENTALGDFSDVATHNLTNATAIGARAEVSTSNSLVLGSVIGVNGATATVNVGIGTTTPLDRLHIVGNFRMVDGNQSAGKVLTSDANGTATWNNASDNAWGLVGNSGTNSDTNFIGTTDNTDLVFRRFNVQSGKISNSNTFFGRLSGSVSTAANNTYLGTESGRDNVTGQENVFIGRRAGAFGTTGSENVLIGNGAGIFNEANRNVFVGSFSGNANSTGGNNSFLGYSSGGITSTGVRNTFLGAFAGSVNTIGTDNTLIGSSANVSTNSLTNASAIGASAEVAASNSLVLGSINGVNSATTTVNVGIGTTTPLDRLHIVGNLRMVDGNQAAGKVLTSNANGTATWNNASDNAWGLTGNAGTDSTTNFIGTTDDTDLIFRRNDILVGRLGISNSSYGLNALSSITSGTNNVANGLNALQSNTTGSFNTAIGGEALADNTIGFDNIAIGGEALRDNTTGSSNVANGSLALVVNDTGSSNTACGDQALRLNRTGNLNTASGKNALLSNISGSENTAVGYSSDVALSNLTNATAIGARAQVGASNSLVLGSIAGVNTATTTVNVGIGTTTPLERLHVAGRAFLTNGFSSDNAALLYRNDTDYMFLGPQSGSSSDGGALALFGSTNVSGGNAGGIDFNVLNGQLRMLSNGNVGIGTTPARKFHVSNGSSGGTSNANTGFVLESSTNVYQHFLTPSASESGLLFGSDAASIHGGIIFDNSDQDIVFRTGGNTNRVIITNAGDVGIGALAPGGQLELSLNEGRKPGSNAWTIVSDQRLKNVNGIFTKGLNEIIQLNPIRYNYKNNGERKFEQQVLNTEFAGFLAQEVQPLFPDAVGTDADGFLNFNIHPILIASINAFKELNLKNQAVENKNRELELKLKSQEQIINNLIERLEKLEAKAKQD